MPLIQTAAYPFVHVKVEPPPPPVAARSPGVVAVVGQTPNGADGGTSEANVPVRVETPDDAVTLFAKRDANGAVVPTKLYDSLLLAMSQDPRPSKIYGVRVDGIDYRPALAALEAVDDVRFVSLAKETNIDALIALKDHVENTSAAGSPRLGVAMVNPTRAPGQTWVADTLASLVTAGGQGLKSDKSRIMVVAARARDDASTRDFATAAMAAVAGYETHISPVLKQIRGVTIPKGLQFRPGEIKALSEEGVIPIIDPELITGEGLFLAEGCLYTADATRPYVDIVRVLDDIEFRLRAGLIGTVGDARITRTGLMQVKTTAEGILAPLKRAAVIDAFDVQIPLLAMLSLPDAARTPADNNSITNARANRVVDMSVVVVYGPQIHQLTVKLKMTFTS